MSSIERRPVVRGTSMSLTNQSQQAMRATGALIAMTAKGLSATAQMAFNAVQSSIGLVSTAIQSAKELRTSAQTMQQQAIAISREQGLSVAEANTVAALAIASNYMVNDPQIITQSLQTLQNNPSAQNLQAFQTTLENAHQQVFVERLSLAVQNAALKVGFTQIASATTSMVNGKMRLAASDDTGRVLVTEISSDRDHDISMATEIIGSSDHTCNQILDAFHAALEAEGVKMGDRDRKFTGGIIELEAARQFVSQKVKPKAKAASSEQTERKATAKPRPVQKQSQIRH
ncbi:MAG: hypothetical protein NW214_09605 [Pseudanabaenaceae cyanobacterium bins.39]|nr:hypothetical protein [Pseudanabaenaceae cyanobacterium bins.39]